MKKQEETEYKIHIGKTARWSKEKRKIYNHIFLIEAKMHSTGKAVRLVMKIIL